MLTKISKKIRKLEEEIRSLDKVIGKKSLNQEKG